MINDLKRHLFVQRSEAYYHPNRQQFDFLQDDEPTKVIEIDSVTIAKHTHKKQKETPVGRSSVRPNENQR